MQYQKIWNWFSEWRVESEDEENVPLRIFKLHSSLFTLHSPLSTLNLTAYCNHFMNLSMAWQRSSMASWSPAATASTMQ